MANAHIAYELDHMSFIEHIPRQAVVLAQVKLVFVTGHDACGILAAVLQYRQAVIDGLIDDCLAYDTYNAAHIGKPQVTLTVESI